MYIMGISEMLDKAIEILKKNFKAVFLYNLVYGIITIVVSVVLLLILSVVSIPLFMIGDLGIGVIFYISLLVLIFGSISLSFNAGIINISSKALKGEGTTVGEGISLSFQSTSKIFAIMFFSLIAFLQVVAIFYFIVRGFFDTFEDIWYSSLNFANLEWLTFIIIPLILLLVISFVVLVYLTFLIFALQELIIENKGPLESIKGSISLVKDSFFKLFKYHLLGIITVFGMRYSFESIVVILTAIIFLISKLFNIDQDFQILFTSLYGIMSFPLGIMLWLVIMPILTIIITIYYYNQRFKREGLDIYYRLQDIKKTRKE